MRNRKPSTISMQCCTEPLWEPHTVGQGPRPWFSKCPYPWLPFKNQKSPTHGAVPPITGQGAFGTFRKHSGQGILPQGPQGTGGCLVSCSGLRRTHIHNLLLSQMVPTGKQCVLATVSDTTKKNALLK